MHLVVHFLLAPTLAVPKSDIDLEKVFNLDIICIKRKLNISAIEGYQVQCISLLVKDFKIYVVNRTKHSLHLFELGYLI